MLNPKTTAFVFPGQGSQFVDMGRELAQASPAAKKIFAEADEILGFPLSTLCWEGPEAALTDTVFLEKTRTLVRQGRRYLTGELDRLKVRYVPSAANFILIQLGPGAAAVAPPRPNDIR